MRTRLVQSGLDRLLLSPVVDVAPSLASFSRRGARLAERLGADRPALTLGSALAELSASALSSSSTSSRARATGAVGAVPGALLDRLAFALHRLIDVSGKPTSTTVTLDASLAPPPLPDELRPLDGALVDLTQRLRPLVDDASLAVVRRRRARVTIDDGPPAGFFYCEDPGPVPPGMLLIVDEAGGGRPLQFIGVRGPLLSVASQLHAVERMLDLVREPLFDEGPRVRRLAGGRYGALLSALDELVVVAEDRPRLCWRVSADATALRPFVRGDAPPLDVGTSLRRIDEAVRATPFATEQDRTIAHTLVARDRFDGVVARTLVGHPFVELADRRALRVVPARPQVEVDAAGRLVLRADGVVIDASALADDGAAAAFDTTSDRLLVIVVDGAERALARAVARLDGASLPPTVVKDVVGRLKQSRLDVALPPALRGDEVPPATPLVVKAAFSPGVDGAPGGARFALVARPLPHGPTFVPGEGPRHVFSVDDVGRPVWCERDLEGERRRAARLFVAADVHGDDVDGPFGFSLHAPERALAAASLLASRNDVVLAVSREGPRIRRVTAEALRIRWTKRTDWLGLDGEVNLPDGTRAELQSLLDALRSGRRYVVLAPGDVAAIDDDVAQALSTLSHFLGPDRALARGAAAVADDVARTLRDAGARVDDGDGWSLADATLAAARAVDGETPPTITATLRPYQQDGLRFLRRLVALGTGGVLADDMGLGKTLTTLCLLAERSALGPQLVVAPTSLGFNWAAECTRFASGALRPVVLQDAATAQERLRWVEQARAGDLLIGSYGVIARDALDARLSSTRFATLVVDEAQAVKNASTARAQALRRLDADVRVALTGTPLQNHTGELWGILDLVSPGLFGTFAQWKARWAQPIEKDDDDDRKARLARALRPFLLRRTKASVATDLPAKVDMTKALEPTVTERAAYERLRAALVLDIEAARGHQEGDDARTLSAGEQRVQILSALTRLRLCACHPGFVDDLDDGAALAPSTKQTALVELVRELVDAGHRALVFSQFVRHLRAAEHALRSAGLRTQSLTGQTPPAERRRLVETFQAADDDSVGVDAFLISLQAGGFGLNLTRASYVIHLDPWWNPAVEDQASDRAHRIGQTLPVTVVRLVMRDTIEEAILALHGSKRALADAVLAGSDAGGTLSVDELRALLTSTRRHSGDRAQELTTTH